MFYLAWNVMITINWNAFAGEFSLAKMMKYFDDPRINSWTFLCSLQTNKTIKFSPLFLKYCIWIVLSSGHKIVEKYFKIYWLLTLTN